MPDEINEVENVEPDVQETPATDVPEAVAPSEGEPTNDTTEAAAEPAEKPEKKSKINNFQRRLDREVWKRHELERELAALKSKPPEDKQEKEPQISDFNTVEEYHAALGRHAAKQEIENYRKTQTLDTVEKQMHSRVQKAESNYEKQLDMAAAKYDDFDDVWANGQIEVPPELFVLIKESEVAGDVIYDMLKHEDTAERLLSKVVRYPNGQLDLSNAIRELGRLESKYMVKKSTPKPAPIPPKVGLSQSKKGDPDTEYAKERARRIMGR